MRFYEARRVIAADPQQIWAVLTDAHRLSDGSFGILEMTGRIAERGRIALRSSVDPKRVFRIRVDRLDAPHLMIWSSGMPLGLFRGTRRFHLASAASGTEVHVREDYTGPLSGMVFKHIPDLTESMQVFLAGLAAATEGEGQ